MSLVRLQSSDLKENHYSAEPWDGSLDDFNKKFVNTDVEEWTTGRLLRFLHDQSSAQL